MQTKTNFDELQNYLTDASNIKGGAAEKVFLPETAQEVSEILREANKNGTKVTISGARTGTVGGAVPFGGVLISLEKLNRIKSLEKTENGGRAIVEAAVLLNDLQRETESKGLFYPPDPTEWSCQIGGNVVTNASGARSFKYGSTRDYVERLEIVLPNGEILHLRRGEILANADGFLRLPLTGGETLEIKLPTYEMPATRKHAAGFFNAPQMDAIDLFIGSEGVLGVVTEIELKLLPKPSGSFSGIVFFDDEQNLLNFVEQARTFSFQNRAEKSSNNQSSEQFIDASLIEYFDGNALEFIRKHFAETPYGKAGAIFFEQETNAENEDAIFQAWSDLLEKHCADTENSWFSTTEADAKKLREFRHALPVSVNEFIVRHGQKKVSTDMAVADEEFPAQLKFYKETLDASGLNYVIFGHIGDGHVHVNILPGNDAEAEKARHIYGRFVARTCIIGGTISAEHGTGRIKRKYLETMFGERFINEMADIKRRSDPNLILNFGVMIDEKFFA